MDRIYYAYTLKQLNYSWKNYMKGFVEATQGVDLYLTGLPEEKSKANKV